MRFFSSAKDADYLGSKLMCSEGVYFVPSFTGMGAPHWDMYARGSIFGLTRGTTREHIIRAALEAIAFQSMDVINAMAVDTDNDINIIKVDGGSSASELIMQFQSDITGKTLVKPVIAETTALGAAFLAGLAVGFWKSKDELKSSWTLDKTYNPIMEKNESDNLIRGWNKAVYCTKLFSEQ
ncbi:Glycerol kinase [bioreactor metagenome]|uniref:Glycerol kinase n=1 Tax=bioreactor metagenome TaxID=1076179 RepID=A0A645FE10_9ZZZZ